MKHLARRGLALFLALVLCIGILPGVQLTADAASVNYQTGTPDSGYTELTSVIKNWGTRGTTATFLSPNAEEFYAENNTTYNSLSQLSGAENVSAVPQSGLYKALQELMTDNHSHVTSYGETRGLFAFTDCENNNTSTISSFYSGKAINSTWDSGATWNREHTWPNSKGDASGDGENDIMMLRPTSSSENSGRGNNAYGESSGFYNPNKTSGGKHNLHGDVARILLYVYVRWGNTGSMWGSDGVIESRDVLLKWMEEDPVDTWEMGRNDSVESITGTRNVFVDYPELAFILFGTEVPEDMATPSGEAGKASGEYTITATSSNNAHGTVQLNGSLITAFPAEGYQAAGFTVVSGTAEVTREGNIFTVRASSDCQIRIDFEARSSVAVSFSENGVPTASQNVYTGDSIKLPAATAVVSAEYSFLGWVTSGVSETAVKPGTIYESGSSYTVTGEVTFYALYSRLDSSISGSGSLYKLYPGALTEGDYLITYEAKGESGANDIGALKAEVSDKGRFNYTVVTVTNNTVDNPAADIIWHIAPDGEYWTIYNAASGKYAGGSGAKNKGKLLDAADDFAKWTATYEDGYEFVNLGNKNKGVNHILRRNESYGYACYAASTGGNLTLYKADASGGALVYTTSVGDVCDHEWVDATCTTPKTCKLCGVTDGKAPGHDYESVVTEPTVTEQGYTTHTCSVCGDSYKDSFVDAVGESHTVSFSVPTGVEEIDDMTCNNAGITLPEAGAPSGDVTYTFVGWAAETVTDSATEPTLYKAGSNYKTQENVKLYAVYTWIDGEPGAGTGVGLYAGEITEGDYVITYVYQDTVGAMKAEVSGANRFNYTDVTVTNNAVVDPAADIIWHIAPTGDGYWTIYNASAGYAAGTGAKNKGQLLETVDEFAKWTITGTETYDIVNLGNTNAGVNNTLQRNDTYGFACYASGYKGPLTLYKVGSAAATVYYTTLTEEAACAHKWTDATCTAPKTCSVCGETEGSALGHTYTNDQDADCDRCGEKREVKPAPNPEQQIKTTPMYRLYNPYSGEHFYTGSTVERDNLVKAGWTYEGVAWNAPVSTGAPVYRLYNPNSGDHHYTMSIEEKDMLVTAGWKYEGVAWNSAAPDNLPLYRLYNPNADCGSHHYTGSTEERDNLVKVGWIYEGIGWFGMLY